MCTKKIEIAFVILAALALTACDRSDKATLSAKSPPSQVEAKAVPPALGMQVESHQWKVLSEFGSDTYEWTYLAKIKNNSNKRCNIYVEYQLVDKDGMQVAMKNKITNIGPNESLDVTESSFMEKRLLPVVAGSKVLLNDNCAGIETTTPTKAKE